MKKSVLLFSMLFAACTVWAGRPSITVFCGAGMRPPMSEAARAFEKANNCRVDVNYAGSGMLLGKLLSGVKADVYMPGDVSWIEKARKKGVVEEVFPVAWWVPVIVVKKGNPKRVLSLADLARKDVRVGLGRPEACAIGFTSMQILKDEGLWSRIRPDVQTTTVNALATQVQIGAVDAAIVWDAVARWFGKDLEVVQLKDPYFYAVPLAASVLKEAREKDLARRFCRFLSGPEGKEIFKRNKHTVTGDTMRIGAGSSFRPVVEELKRLFEKRTGCRVLTDYGGSGTVLLQIEHSRSGDVYICHDPFAAICEKKGLSAGWYTVAYVEPVLAVRKGNPKHIKGLMDLVRKDVRVGLPHRKYTTKGVVLWKIFEKAGIADKMRKRKIFEDRRHALVNQLLIGSVDVAVLWDAMAKNTPGIEVIPIEDKYWIDTITSATSGKKFDARRAKVTVVRLTVSKEPLLAAQFAKLCLSEEGRRIFAKYHFQLPKSTRR